MPDVINNTNPFFTYTTHNNASGVATAVTILGNGKLLNPLSQAEKNSYIASGLLTSDGRVVVSPLSGHTTLPVLVVGNMKGKIDLAGFTGNVEFHGNPGIVGTFRKTANYTWSEPNLDTSGDSTSASSNVIAFGDLNLPKSISSITGTDLNSLSISDRINAIKTVLQKHASSGWATEAATGKSSPVIIGDDDILAGGIGISTVIGNAGSDVLSNYPNEGVVQNYDKNSLTSDLVLGQEGDDNITIVGNSNSSNALGSFAFAGLGNDTLTANSYNYESKATLYGGSGDNSFYGSIGNEKMVGVGSHDYNVEDMMTGVDPLPQVGDNIFYLSPGNDTIHGTYDTGNTLSVVPAGHTEAISTSNVFINSPVVTFSVSAQGLVTITEVDQTTGSAKGAITFTADNRTHTTTFNGINKIFTNENPEGINPKDIPINGNGQRTQNITINFL